AFRSWLSALSSPCGSMSSRIDYDYVVIGGGTAGAVVAARLAEERSLRVCLLEAGPADEGDARVLELRNWPNLLGSELDYDYRIEPQERGNGRIRHSRGRVLGGCSSHNSAIAFPAPAVDLRTWEELGAAGWGPEGTRPYFDRILARVHLETAPPANACAAAFVEAAQQAGFPLVSFATGDIREGVGWFRLNKRGPIRQSSSVVWLHPLNQLPNNLTILTNTPTWRLVLDEQGHAVAAETARGIIRARQEIILCCGAFDTPKLLLLSGIGPAQQLRPLGIPVRVDLPGVGAHLIDHPEGIVLWEAARPVPEVSTQFWEAGLFVRTDPALAWPDLMYHFGTVPFDLNTVPLGYPTAGRGSAFCLTPNVTRARSEGVIQLQSADPGVPPRIDFRYFTDPDGHDERVLLAGVKLARRLAEQPALRVWIKRELAPGPEVQDDAALSDYARRTANTVYHPAGTCRLGAADDPDAVVDPALRVRGVGRLRVADASIFPAMIGVNPCLTCMMIGEKCASLVLDR
ncbi:MAG: GMC family oxidoreductase N-terminal domain-containing protein, partial [Gemmataceae bacterium]|nr:GMC family oxidoreductase N-terminal domain-containing protein [Gemmataceae bacterium]